MAPGKSSGAFDQPEISVVQGTRAVSPGGPSTMERNGKTKWDFCMNLAVPGSFWLELGL